MALASTVRLGMAVPQVFLDTPVDMALVRRVAQRSEALGFESLWTNEGILSDAPSLDPLVLLSYVAALTSTAWLGVSVLVFPLHSPVHVARRVGSLDQASGGRAIVGLGLGGRSDVYATFGLTTERRVRRFEEGVQVMKALWTQPVTSYHGDFYHLDNAKMEPKPVQQPHPHIWLGGSHPNVLRRSVRMADGWMGGGASSTADFKQHVPELRRRLEEAGRDPGTFTISKRVYIAVEGDEAGAERELRRWFGAVYRNPDLASRVSVWGSPERCAELLEDIASVGVDHLLLNPVYAPEEQMEAVAEVAGLK